MTDILVIGSGGAGLTAALEAKKRGKSVIVLSKTHPTSSQTCQAQGGINGVLGNNDDNIQNHINDTLRSAHNLGDEKTISYLCENAADTINWLDSIGVPFSRDKNNDIAQRSLGGASNPRACYSSDYTGLKILHTLYDNCLKEGIEFINEHMVLDFIVENGVVKGVTSLDIETTKVKQIAAKKVITASGGYGGIYINYNTNSTATTGDTVAAALRAGCELSNMEYIQFHPTALKDLCVLLSESARGEGGYLVTKDGNRFTDELAPRDVVARAIYEKIKNNQEVYLDLRHLGLEKIKETMPQEYDLALQFANLKLDEDLIPVMPAAHYTMGGIKTDINGKTNINGLYAVGECSSNGVHGANRLGGNSLLEIITFGKRTAGAACEDIKDTASFSEKEYPQYKHSVDMIENIFKKENRINFYERKKDMGEVFYNNVGLFRSKELLDDTYLKVKQWQEESKATGIEDKSRIYNTQLKELIEFNNMVQLCEAIVLSAINRKESRGAHYRTDYKNENPDLAKESIIIKEGTALKGDLI